MSHNLRDDYDCGDNLHPNDAGYKAMAEAVDLDLLLGKRKGADVQLAAVPMASSGTGLQS